MKTKVVGAVALSGVLCMVVACGQTQSSALGNASGAAAVCTAGDTRVCVGPGACAGGERCGDDGRWGACDCGSAGAGGAGGATSGTSGAATSGSGGAGTSGHGGSGALAGGGGINVSGNGGATAGTGGSGNTSGGGAAGASGGAAGASGLAGASGSAGAGGLAGSAGAAGMQPQIGPLLDNLSDGDNTLAPFAAPGGAPRIGYWYTFASPGSTIWPTPDASGASPFIACSTATSNCNLGPGHTVGGADYWAESNGTVVATAIAPFPYAGMGFDLNDTGIRKPYDASAYAGISFWGKASVSLLVRLEVVIPSISKVADGGTCTGTGCDDQYGMAASLGTAWTQFLFPFASLTQQGYGTPTVFTQNAITDVLWRLNGPESFDFAVDDISFY